MNSPVQVFDDVPCTACGCVCDDLTLHIEQGRVVHAVQACSLAEARLARIGEAVGDMAEIQGEPARFDDALAHAAQRLAEANHPLICGLTSGSVPGHRAAIHLAETLRASLDVGVPSQQAAAIVASQGVGQSTCTLGELRQRADVVLCWRSDPATTHPRFFERYLPAFSRAARSERRAACKLVVVDHRPTPTAEFADDFIQLDSNDDLAAIHALRLMVAGRYSDDAENVPSESGVSPESWQSLAESLANARYASLLFTPCGNTFASQVAVASGLLQLVRELSAQTRAVAHCLTPGAAGGKSAQNVLCWQTGYPLAVNFRRGFPQYDPYCGRASELISLGEVDACLLVGADPLTQLPEAAREKLRQMPCVLIEPALGPTVGEQAATEGEGAFPVVRLRTAVDGVHSPGTAYRLDDVPLPLRLLIFSNYPSEAEVLGELREAVCRLARARRPLAASNVSTHVL